MKRKVHSWELRSAAVFCSAWTRAARLQTARLPHARGNRGESLNERVPLFRTSSAPRVEQKRLECFARALVGQIIFGELEEPHKCELTFALEKTEKQR